MNIAQIEENLQKITASFNEESFIFDLLLAYGKPKTTVKRLQNSLNLSTVQGEVHLKKMLLYKVEQKDNINALLEKTKAKQKVNKNAPRFLIITDYKTLVAYDTKINDSLEIPILEIPKHFDFFLPLAGMEKTQYQSENPADVKASEKMARLYGEIKKDNPTNTEAEIHNLNVFLSRLLFCFFAEDTGIFEKGQFTNGIGSHTQQDGSDLNTYLDNLFKVLNTEKSKRTNLPAYLKAFDYVNGGLFRNEQQSPVFTRRSRQLLIDSGDLDWSAINPDIFGSMIQAVITPEHRGGLGMHYTSVPNIMKVIEPLFLNELYEEFEEAKGFNNKLTALLHKIWKIKIFDPACGSGNFLIIAYKELRKLEMKIFKAMDSLALSNIDLGNFYGIEIDDFAHEIAILSLWLAEHQMNQEFSKEFNRSKPALPLKQNGNIVHGNATRLDWVKVCPKKEGDIIFVLGNPPYLGTRNQETNHKLDMGTVFKGVKDYKNLDYIACWFYLGAHYIKGTNNMLAFVTTSSICQGDQVSLLWPLLFVNKIDILFAVSTFKWSNSAKQNAGVSVNIIGIKSNLLNRKKYIYTKEHKLLVENINPYLMPGKNIIVNRRNTPLCKLFPQMIYGSEPRENGYLMMTVTEKNELLKEYSGNIEFIKRVTGSNEFIKGIERYCIWLNEYNLEKANTSAFIQKRLLKTKQYRQTSKRKDTREFANKPYLFTSITHHEAPSIIVPIVSSEDRKYIPFGFINDNPVILNSAQVIYNPESIILGIISSTMHMLWVKATAGRLESRLRYSSTICYNNFPFPEISEDQKKELEKCTYKVLEVRETSSEKTLSQLYDSAKMPVALREAHYQLDLAVERCYRTKPFESDEERLEFLFKLYEQMVEEEKTNGTLFEAKPKSKRKIK